MNMVWDVDTTEKHNSDIAMDKYEKSVDFQNDCRSFYLNRVKATERFKKTLQVENKVPRKTSLSAAMDKLRSEMASLVDQDLSLMKQMLTLNETIEELKNKRLYGMSKESLEDSTTNIKSSTCALCKNVSTLSLSSGEFVESNITEDDTEVKEQMSQKRRLKHRDSCDSGYGD